MGLLFVVPGRGYKKGMQLVEALRQLNLEPPVRFEAKAPMSERGRCLGTSLRTVLELYLDLDLASRKAGLIPPTRVSFLLVCLAENQGRHLLDTLRKIHEKLGLDVDLRQVQVQSIRGLERLRGRNYRSWEVFCDHTVKEAEGISRLRGPEALIRKAVQVSPRSWEAYDRDMRLVCLLTWKGLTEITDLTSCPITYIYNDGTPSTTFPAYSGVSSRLEEFRV